MSDYKWIADALTEMHKFDVMNGLHSVSPELERASVAANRAFLQGPTQTSVIDFRLARDKKYRL